jgi:hypothetical protein
MAFPSLVLGAFNLTDWSGSAYQTQVIAEGTSKGSPVPLEVAVKSWLQDGSIVVTQGYDNRTVTLRVKLRGLTLTAVSQAEAALNAELGKPNTLTWTPASGPASVFVVVTSSMDLAPSTDEDIAEGLAAYPWRTYNIRLLCEAFTRSAAETTAAALAANGTTTTNVDTGSATTNWTGAVNGVTTSPSVVSGAVGISSAATLNAQGTATVDLTRTSAITTSATKYLVVDWKGQAGLNPAISATGDGVDLLKVGQAPSPTAGYTRTWFYAAAASVTALRLRASFDGNGLSLPQGSSVTLSFFVDNLDRSDIKPAIGTARQTARSLDIVGSARTQGSLAIEHASSALGDLLVLVWPEEAGTAYQPPLRPWRVSGGTVTTDSATVSGATEPITGSTATYDVPLSKLIDGLHLVSLRLKPSVINLAASVTWTTQVRVNGVDVGPSQTGTTAMVLSSGLAQTAFEIFTIGRTQLPPTDVDTQSTTAVVRVTLAATSSGTVTLDEAWLLNTDVGQFVQVGCGTAAPSSGGTANRAWIEPAAVGRPRPTVRIGFASDRSDSFFPSTMKAWQAPQFKPPRMNIFVVTTNALDPTVTLRHFPRWHTNAAS